MIHSTYAPSLTPSTVPLGNFKPQIIEGAYRAFRNPLIPLRLQRQSGIACGQMTANKKNWKKVSLKIPVDTNGGEMANAVCRLF